MDFNEKIVNVLKKAANYLHASIESLNKNNETSFSNDIWHVGAELEYALFLFSMSLQDEYDNFKWKQTLESKENVKQVLFEVNNLLEQAQKCMENRQLYDACKNVYIARHYVFKIQADITKKKREASKKK